MCVVFIYGNLYMCNRERIGAYYEYWNSINSIEFVDIHHNLIYDVYSDIYYYNKIVR